MTLRIALLSLVLLGAPLGCLAADPVKDFETLVQKSAAASEGIQVYRAPAAEKWVKRYVTVFELSYDVRTTDSLVTPVVGAVMFRMRTKLSAPFDSQAEAQASTAINSAFPDRLSAVTLHYAWLNDRWVFSTGDVESWFDKPGMPRDRFKVTRETLVGSPTSTLRAWLP